MPHGRSWRSSKNRSHGQVQNRTLPTGRGQKPSKKISTVLAFSFTRHFIGILFLQTNYEYKTKCV